MATLLRLITRTFSSTPSDRLATTDVTLLMPFRVAEFRNQDVYKTARTMIPALNAYGFTWSTASLGGSRKGRAAFFWMATENEQSSTVKHRNARMLMVTGHGCVGLESELSPGDLLLVTPPFKFTGRVENASTGDSMATLLRLITRTFSSTPSDRLATTDVTLLMPFRVAEFRNQDVYKTARSEYFMPLLNPGSTRIGVRDDLHFPIEARGTNIDGSLPIYKNPDAPIEDRVSDVLPRMTVQEKVAQLIQGDINRWMNMTDPLDNTLAYNQSGLEQMMEYKAGSTWAGYLVSWDKIVYGITVGQKYLMENTTLGIPAIFQSEGRVEENYGEDPFLTSQMGRAYVTGLQSGRRRNVSSTAIARMAATCKHFAAFGSPQGGLNLAQVSGGERELRTYYLKPFNHACVNALSIMTAHSSYDDIPNVANTFQLKLLRKGWGYQYFVTSDAGSVDYLITLHGVCPTRECAAKVALEHGLSGEMGGGTYTYLALPDQIAKGTVNITYVDETVKTILRTKFALGLFETPTSTPLRSSDRRQTGSSPTICTNEGFNVTVTVHNTGCMDGKEVVQVYMTDLYSSVVTPNMQLIGFTKVSIPAGQSSTVTIPIMSSQLAVWTVTNQWVVEPGEFNIFVGTSEEVYLDTILTVR
ncbi:glycoside hydrolase family 3 protein [Paxillus involutus ATCC 200175]|uniref:xylan 1,4-beta-xylosidase n=1 Tax=Paxillus involutus ATCC 200175 TaxID=664439 RepID=A0A0C9U3T2_PAXIN|nr:glycoside hydrolase family 3 protein [Paxillus involutus ATCC 200175]